MQNRRFDWHERIKAVEREFWSVRIAIARLLELAQRDPCVLGEGPRPQDIRAAAENIEGTYVVRMFAEFETGLRTYWTTILPRARRTAVETLLDRVGDLRDIRPHIVRGTHEVREHRNHLVHHRDREIGTLTIAESRRRLATYFSRLPIEWPG
jgi:hypothetical protein